jgi:hypothetical protein
MTVASILKGSDVKPVLFVDPHDPKKTHKIVPTDAIEQVLKDKGLIKSTRSDQARKQNAAAEREREKRELQDKHRALCIETLSERLRDGAITAFSGPMLRILLLTLLEGGDYDGDEVETLTKLWHLPDTGQGGDYSAHRERRQALLRHIRAVNDELLGVMVLQVLLALERPLQRQDPTTYDWTSETPAINQVAEELGVDLDAIMTDLKAEHAAARRAAKQATEPADSPGTTVEAAPQGSIARAPKGGSKRTKAAGGATRKRISEGEAKQGIAEAMQGIGEPGRGGAEVELSEITTLSKDEGATIKAFLSGESAGGEAADTQTMELLPIEAGMTIRVIDAPSDTKKLKWAGKQGHVLGATGDGRWDVSFSQRGGGRVSFDQADLQVSA